MFSFVKILAAIAAEMERMEYQPDTPKKHPYENRKAARNYIEKMYKQKCAHASSKSLALVHRNRVWVK